MRRLILAVLASCASAPLLAQAAPSPAKPAQANAPFVRAEAHAAVEELAKQLEERFVFPDAAKAYAARLRSQLAAGAYSNFASAKAFAEAVTADLQAVHKDGHLKMGLVPKDAPAGAPGKKGPPPGFKFISKAGWIADGVAYIRFEAFPGNEETLAELRSFIDSHKQAKSLIIDLRGNHGGGLAEMDVLFPAIFDKPATLVMMDTRIAAEKGSEDDEPEPTLKELPGPEGVVRRAHTVTPAAKRGSLATAKVYVLTSKQTVSAGEHFSLSLKRTRRATLIGETTRGAGHYGGVVKLGDTGYAAFIPVGRTFDPDTGEGWEGTGVKPDIAVPADKALDEALKLAGVEKSGDVALAQLK